ncbi:MAG: hypothetical protein LBJ59_12170 [Zoogloeaceae bacterium]|jgi:hypothetical protein|nr:hypothetical protein [Zoogloeaceae bacterium]
MIEYTPTSLEFTPSSFPAGGGAQRPGQPSPSSAPREVIADLTTGLRLIATLPTDFPQKALSGIRHIVDCLAAQPPEIGVYLDVLEQARVSLYPCCESLGERYRDNSLPLRERDEDVFRQTMETLRAMGKAYEHCVQALLHDRSAYDDQARARKLALALYRVIYYSCAILCEHYAARQEMPAGLWQQINRHYALAEEHDLAQKIVPEPIREENQDVCPATAYLAFLLIEIANPYNYSLNDQQMIRHLAWRWASLVSIRPVDSLEDAPTFVIDLKEDKGLHQPRNGMVSDSVWHPNIAFLTEKIRDTQAQMADGATPEQLGLGEISVTRARRLLGKLLTPWSLLSSPRRFRRFATKGEARVTLGFEPMYTAIANETFQQPDSAGRRSLITPLDNGLLPPTEAVHHEFIYDAWDVIDYSVNGFRLCRHIAGQQIAYSQLIAVSSQGGANYQLGKVSWLIQDNEEDSLNLGVSMLPGNPQGVAVRSLTAPRGDREPYAPAFRLPPLTPDGEAMLVLPKGTFAASRGLSLVCDEKVSRINLQKVVQRGLDFEVASYLVVETK